MSSRSTEMGTGAAQSASGPTTRRTTVFVSDSSCTCVEMVVPRAAVALNRIPADIDPAGKDWNRDPMLVITISLCIENEFERSANKNKNLTHASQDNRGGTGQNPEIGITKKVEHGPKLWRRDLDDFNDINHHLRLVLRGVQQQGCVLGRIVLRGCRDSRDNYIWQGRVSTSVKVIDGRLGGWWRWARENEAA